MSRAELALATRTRGDPNFQNIFARFHVEWRADWVMSVCLSGSLFPPPPAFGDETSSLLSSHLHSIKPLPFKPSQLFLQWQD